jgi:hypothetical protein
MREPHVLGVPEQEMVVAASSSLKNYNKLYVVQINTKIKLNVYTFYAGCAKIENNIILVSCTAKAY